jgi:hypothetical protein
MLDTNDFKQIIKDLNRSSRMLNQQRKQEKLQREYEKAKRVQQGTEFGLKIFYRDSVKYDGRPVYERIDLEGFDTAKLVYDEYRKIGFTIKIQSMELMLGKEMVMGVNFKHNIDK